MAVMTTAVVATNVNTTRHDGCHSAVTVKRHASLIALQTPEPSLSSTHNATLPDGRGHSETGGLAYWDTAGHMVEPIVVVIVALTIIVGIEFAKDWTLNATGHSCTDIWAGTKEFS